METLQETNEFKALPALAALLGHDYNISAKTWPVSILLFRMAMSSELLHKTEEQADLYLNQKYPSRAQVLFKSKGSYWNPDRIIICVVGVLIGTQTELSYV